MAKPKRTKQEIINDDIYISELYLKGYSYRKIAEVFNKEGNRMYNLSHVQIGYDILRMLKEWRAERKENIDDWITIELAKINNLEKSYWVAWEKSKTDYTEEKIINKGKTTESLNTESITAFGEPRFLQGIERCIQKRIDILGLEATKRVDLTHKNVSETTIFRVKSKSLEND